MSRSTVSQGKIELGPLSRSSLVQRVQEQLREHILADKFGADGVLPAESQLTHAFGVSRPVIREAMQGLRMQGLVEISQGRRPRVKPVSLDDAAQGLDVFVRRREISVPHLMDIRLLLEPRIAELAASRADQTEYERLQRSIDAMRQAHNRDDQVEQDTQFHRILARATGNPMYEVILEAIAGPLYNSRRTTIGRVGTHNAIEGHVAILNALRKHDPVAARRAMLAHLRLAQHDLGNESERAGFRHRHDAVSDHRDCPGKGDRP